MEYAYRFRIYPTKKQEGKIQRSFGCCRFVYNYYLNKRLTLYHQNGTNYNYYKCASDLTQIKSTYPWLAKVDSTALQSALQDLDHAFQRYYRNKHAGLPGGCLHYKKGHFKKQSYRSKRIGTNIELSQSAIKLPKLGWVKCKVSKEVQGRILSVTVKRTASGQYYVSILCTEVEPKKHDRTGARLIITSDKMCHSIAPDGTIDQYPVCSGDGNNEQLARLQTKARTVLSRKPMESKRKKRCYQKIAKKREAIQNQKLDAVHKFTTSVVMQHDVIYLDNRIESAEWIRQIRYKCKWYGTELQICNTQALLNVTHSMKAPTGADIQ